MGACSPIKCSPGAIVYQDNGCSAIDCKVYCASDGTHYFVSDNGANSGCAGTNYTDLSAANACAMDGYGGPTAPIPSAPGKWHITSYPFSLS